MVVYLTRNLKSRTRRLLSAYSYEIASGVFISSYHAGLYVRIIKWLEKNVDGRQKVLVVRRDPLIAEGFSEKYINWESMALDVDGLKLYKTFRGEDSDQDIDFKNVE